MLLTFDPHQIVSQKYLLDNPFSIAALEMGLGKSPVTLGVFENVGGRLLVVCPSYLILNWKDEIDKCFGEGRFQVTMIRKGEQIYDLFDTDICITSYDLAQKSEYLFEWATMLVADEGQELKSMKAKRTEYFHRVVYENSIKRLHILTGTPITNRVQEYYSLLALMNYDPNGKPSDFLDRFPDEITFADYFSFRHEFKMELPDGRRIPIVKWDGVRNKEELKGYLKNHYIRYLSKDVLLLKPLRYKDILISEIEDKKLFQAFTSYYEKDGTESVNPTYKAEAALKTVPFTVKYVKDLLQQRECVVIYTDHKLSCEALAQAFGVPAITGDMPSKRRFEIGKRFQNGEGQVIASTYKSFSTGVNLTRAKDEVQNDPSWVPGVIQQAEFRIQRRGQTQACTIHRIHGSPQSKRIYEKLQEKMITIGEVT